MSQSLSLDTSRVWFITGASSGFGRSLAEAVLTHGGLVVATARNPSQLYDLKRTYPGRALAIALDVTNTVQVKEAVARAEEEFGKIDVLVNNAGYGLLGAVEEVSDADTRRQFDANVFGLLNVTRAVLPGMRSRRSGHVINMSSVGGFAARAGFAIYNASKFAVEGLSEAMAQELAPLGIRVMIIEPGFFRTEFLGRSLAMAPPIADYADTVGRVRGAIHSGKLVGDPARAAQAIIKAVESPNPPLRLVLGKDALARIRNKLTRVTRELESWEEVSSSTDFQ